VRRVDAQRTPISASVAKDAIGRAYAELTGEALDGTGQSILTAQWAHETGHGASMYNYNFGGIKGTGPSGLSVSQRTREGYGANERQIVDQFRAYGSVDEGAKDYVRLLLNRYGDAVHAAKQGDASGFVRGLKQKGYFTGDPAAYERSIKSIANQLGSSAGATERVASNEGVVANRWHGASAETGKVNHRSISSLDEQFHDRLLLSRIQHDSALLAAPQPTALLDNNSSDDGASNNPMEGGPEGLSVMRAISMADEISRSVLQIAKEDAERRRTGKSDD
jgi:flagellar protein FlgJ